MGPAAAGGAGAEISTCASNALREGRATEAKTVDHITPKGMGEPMRKVICKACAGLHYRKTATERNHV